MREMVPGSWIQHGVDDSQAHNLKRALRGKSGDWESIGPSRARFRTSAQPRKFNASAVRSAFKLRPGALGRSKSQVSQI